jgi:deoxyribonuclease-4
MKSVGEIMSIGKSFEEIAAILKGANHHLRLGVCLDTCHLLASGYDIASAHGYTDVFAQFENLIGLPRLQAFHLNDSKKPLGSRVDRHEHIGKGFVGLDAFRRLLNDARFVSVPMMLETPKASGKSSGPIAVDAFDAENLQTLRQLCEK